MRLWVWVILLIALIFTACDVGSDPDASPLEDLQVVGVDFELNSMIISNNGDEAVRTEGLFAFRDGESFEFNIFTIAPRATILFSMRDLGDIATSGGEIALAESASFSDPDSLLDYVAWGTDGFELSEVATDAGLWPPEGTVEVEGDTVLLLRTDPTGNGPTTWEATSQAP